ncbi:MAG TPA: glutamate-5-semialdehyde dehydrogenase [Actinomycetota bacterium]|nr:glutamate-5-semialdehyde dehydrogenase [Actinomycetota bacterium]
MSDSAIVNVTSVRSLGERARAASAILAQTPGAVRRTALLEMADALDANLERLVAVNAEDVEAARGTMTKALVDRLTLTPSRLADMSGGLRTITEQPDPVGEVVEEWTRPNGLKIQKIRRPIGVVSVIYEARPNVTADVAGLCIMSGNAVLLRGSSSALRTNVCITGILVEAATAAGLPENAIQLVEDTSRESAVELMQLKGLVDLLIPRGGPALIASIEENATVPYIIDGDGNCHVYVDRAADPEMATNIIVNAKTSKPSVCNAAEKLVVHADLAGSWLPVALGALTAKGVEIRGDEAVQKLWPSAVPATDDDWGTEYLDLVLAVKVVAGIDEAIDHVNRWGTSNAEAIVTEDVAAAQMFTKRVDSGTVFVNASTRFSDGGQFGYGAEIGISTQKLHARGPLGLRELTSSGYVVWGTGQVRT